MQVSIAVLLLFGTTLSAASDTLDFLVKTEDTVYTAFRLAEGGQSIYIDADTLHLTKRLDLLASNVNVVGKSTLTTLICPPDSEAMYIEGTGVHVRRLRIVGCKSNHSALKINSSTIDRSATSETNAAVVLRECVFEEHFVGSDFSKWSTVSKSVDGGAVSVYGNTQNVVVDRCHFKRNVAERGAAIYIHQDSKLSINVLNSVFVKNKANSLGGAIYVNQKSEITVLACTFVENEASSDGGAIRLNVATGSIVGSSFVGGHSRSSGGGVAAATSDLTIQQSRFIMNKADQSGGAVYSNGPSTVSISTSTFIDNYAALKGGAISVEDSSILETDGLEFDSNVAASDNSTNDIYYSHQLGEAIQIYTT